MKKSDINKVDDRTKSILNGLLDIGFKIRELGVYTMYANVHITLPSGIPITTVGEIVNLLPFGSSLSAGNHFRSGLTLRLPWNLPSENYEKRETVFD